MPRGVTGTEGAWRPRRHFGMLTGTTVSHLSHVPLGPDIMYAYLPYVCKACGGQKRGSDPLVLELEMTMSHQVLGSKPRSSVRASCALNIGPVFLATLSTCKI